MDTSEICFFAKTVYFCSFAITAAMAAMTTTIAATIKMMDKVFDLPEATGVVGTGVPEPG